MPRKASHRRDNRLGPENRWLQKKAWHIARILRPVAAGHRLMAAAIPVGPGLYQIPPALVLDFRVTLDDALPYLHDEDGRVWE
jgi:hypothetical protein